MSVLSERMRAQRARWIDVGEGIELQILRPQSDAFFEFSADMSSASRALAIARSCVGDWRGMRESVLLPGVGVDDEIGFDLDAYREWLADRPDVIAQVADECLADYTAWRARREESAGK